MIKYLIFLSSFYLQQILPYGIAEKDYCNIEGCASNLTHIACSYNETYSDQRWCGENPEIKNLDGHQEQIVSVINSFRNNVALGSVSDLPKAAKMPTLIWDNELEYLASLGVQLCSPGDEFCYSTEIFPNVGRNTFLLTSINQFPINIIISLALTEWYNNGQNISQNDITNYDENCVEMEKFILMINDRCTKIGCALLETSYLDHGDKHYQTYFDCLFSCTNILGQPVYTAGTNDCENINPQFPGLCATNNDNVFISQEDNVGNEKGEDGDDNDDDDDDVDDSSDDDDDDDDYGDGYEDDEEYDADGSDGEYDDDDGNYDDYDYDYDNDNDDDEDEDE